MHWALAPCMLMIPALVEGQDLLHIYVLCTITVPKHNVQIGPLFLGYPQSA